MPTCKRCGGAIVWPQPYKAGQRPLNADGQTLHDCPEFGKEPQQQEQKPQQQSQTVKTRQTEFEEVMAQLDKIRQLLEVQAKFFEGFLTKQQQETQERYKRLDDHNKELRRQEISYDRDREEGMGE